jgi:hypothetical protein
MPVRLIVPFSVPPDLRAMPLGALVRAWSPYNSLRRSRRQSSSEHAALVHASTASNLWAMPSIARSTMVYAIDILMGYAIDTVKDS